MAALAAGKEGTETCFQLLRSPFLFSMSILFKSSQRDVRVFLRILLWIYSLQQTCKSFPRMQSGRDLG